MDKSTILPLLLAGIAGGVGATVLGRLTAEGAPSGAAAEPAAVALPGSTGPANPAERPDTALLPADWQPRLEALEAQVTSLSAELELARSVRRTELREPGAAPPPELESLLAEVNSTGGDFGQYILDLIDGDVERREQEREDEEAERRQTASLERAQRVAEELGLNDYERDQVAEVFLGEMTRMSEARDLARAGDGGGMRDAFRAVRTWRDEELEVRLGSDLAQQIDESEGSRFGGRGPGGGGGGGRRGGGDDGGGGGQTDGGGGRRNRGGF